MTRRDQCHFVGRRASLLTPPQAAAAWDVLARRVESMGEMDMPKFRNLIQAVRAATIFGKSVNPDYELHKGHAERP